MDTELVQIESELQEIQFKPCKWDWLEEVLPMTPTGIEVLPIPNKDSIIGYDWAVYGIHDRLGIECSISGDPENDGVLVILADMLVPGKRLVYPFSSVKYARKELPRLIHEFALI